jgi:hypothetical protein
MTPGQFSPGFRLSIVDALVIAAATIGAVALGSIDWTWGFVIGFVVCHFFLFCNVVRMSRPLELTWGAVFVALSAATITTGAPGWVATTAISIAVTTALVIVQVRSPSYHGIGWQRINPELPEWWQSRQTQ